MKDTYKVKYRQPGQIFWRTIRNVKGDGIEGNFRYFHTEDDELIYISCHAEVVFFSDRQLVITGRMSREVGCSIQRA